jgi:hypothetical protein
MSDFLVKKLSYDLSASRYTQVNPAPRVHGRSADPLQRRQYRSCPAKGSWLRAPHRSFCPETPQLGNQAGDGVGRGYRFGVSVHPPPQVYQTAERPTARLTSSVGVMEVDVFGHEAGRAQVNPPNLSRQGTRAVDLLGDRLDVGTHAGICSPPPQQSDPPPGLRRRCGGGGCVRAPSWEVAICRTSSAPLRR